MAFTGTPTVHPVSDHCVRITGIVLANAAAGTIGLHGDGTAGVQLPAAFSKYVEQYEYAGEVVSQADALQASAIVATATSAVNTSVRIAKGGTPFQVTLTNDGAAPTPASEMYVRWG